MLSYKESLKILKEANALIEGHFILSSGLHSPQYVQCAQLMSKPDKAKDLCISLSEKIKNEFDDFDIILSPAMGGIVIGYACIIDRSKGQSTIKEKIVSQIELDIPTYTKDDLPKSLASIKAVKPGSRNL